MTNFTDDTMPHNTNANIESLINDLLHFVRLVWEYFFKLNADKCKLLVTKHEEDIAINNAGENIVGHKSVKLLGIQIENNQFRL